MYTKNPNVIFYDSKAAFQMLGCDYYTRAMDCVWVFTALWSTSESTAPYHLINITIRMYSRENRAPVELGRLRGTMDGS